MCMEGRSGRLAVGVRKSVALSAQEKLRRFDEQVSPHLTSAYNLARWLTRNHQDAEDVVQEAFLRAFSAFESLRGDDPKPWLLKIVRNTSLTWMKKHRQATLALDEPGMEDPRDPSPNPEETLLISSSREDVEKALEQLPSDFREAIVLRELEGLSYKEISAATGAPLGTIMSRLSRGREWLRRILSNAGCDKDARRDKLMSQTLKADEPKVKSVKLQGGAQ